MIEYVYATFRFQTDLSYLSFFTFSRSLPLRWHWSIIVEKRTTGMDILYKPVINKKKDVIDDKKKKINRNNERWLAMASISNDQTNDNGAMQEDDLSKNK